MGEVVTTQQFVNKIALKIKQCKKYFIKGKNIQVYIFKYLYTYILYIYILDIFTYMNNSDMVPH